MEPRSGFYDNAVINGGNAFATVDIRRAGVLLATDLLLAEGGQVTVDGTATTRRSLTAQVIDVDGTLAPTGPTSILAPYGSEAEVKVGFRYVDGTIDQIPVGVFRLTSSVAASSGLISIEGPDRSSVVAAARFETPYVIPAGTDLATAIRNLLDSRFPGLTYDFTTTTTTVPLTVFEEGDRSGDPWLNAVDLARKGGMELFFNVRGQPTLRAVADPASAPIVWTHEPGPDSVIIDSANKLTSEDVRNVAIVSGEGTGVVSPVRSSREITDPSNPIYPGGPIGRRPVFLVSPLITTQAQADAASLALLQRQAGGGELLGFSAVGHPAHDAGDVVRVVSPKIGVDDIVVLSKFTLPLELRSAVAYQTLGRRSA